MMPPGLSVRAATWPTARLPKMMASAARANMRMPSGTLPFVAVRTLEALKKMPLPMTVPVISVTAVSRP